MKKAFFVTGIGTNVGKTVMSAVLCKAIGSDYWKPIQAGDLHETDSDRIASWTGGNVRIHPERYRLKEAASPHSAAMKEGIEIRLEDFKLPETSNRLIVEGAGGLMVPINSRGDLIIDLIVQLKLPVILVSRFYLGSINHTLLSLELLKNKGIELSLLLFSGEMNEDSKSAILQKYPDLQWAYIPEIECVDSESIARHAKDLPQGWI